MNVTNDQLDQAMEAWKTARETAARQYKAWGELLNSHGSLIESMLKTGYKRNSSEAEGEFDALTRAHAQAQLGAWEAMDARLREFRDLLRRYEAAQDQAGN